MGREIMKGDTVPVHGRNHRGKRAIVLDIIPQMFYIQFQCSGDRTRVMSYNIILEMDSHYYGIIEELRSMQETVKKLPKNDLNTKKINYKEEIIKEIGSISDSIGKLATLLQAVDFKWFTTCYYKNYTSGSI